MTLRQISKKWFRIGHTLQCAAFLSFIGGNTAMAHYVPDTNLQPVWHSTEPEPEGGADTSDHDLDGLPAWFELWLGTDPLLYDTDYDGINDGDELFSTLTNPLNWDTDGNGQSDLADFYTANPPAENPGTTEEEATTSTDPSAEESAPADSDGDGLSDDFETSTPFTDPNIADTNGNGRSDYDDYYYPVANLDTDSDGVPDTTETTEGTDPNSVDTDGDGLTDGEETNIFFTDPNNAYSRSSQYTDWYMVDTTDSDGGGIPDRIEIYLGMNPNDASDDLHGDLDGDGVSNVDAYNEGTSPDANITENYDRDGDGMTDVWEVANGLNPDDASDAGGDPDGDGYNNLAEFQRGTDPHVADLDAPPIPETGGDSIEPDPLTWSFENETEEPEPDFEMASSNEPFWTWGNFLGIISVAASIAGLVSTSPIIAGVGLVAGLWWLANEIADYYSDLPDINDSPVWP